MCPKCGQEPCKCKKIILTAPFDTLGVPLRKIRTVEPPENKDSLEVTLRRKKQKIVTTSLKAGYEADDESEEKLSASETTNLLEMEATTKLRGYRTGEKVKIFNKDDLKQFVEISWPKEATAYNVIASVVRIMVEQYMGNRE